MYNNPDPGEAIWGLGASQNTEENPLHEPEYPTAIEHPSNSKGIYYSRASLEGVCKVECFLDDNNPNGVQSCIGVLLHYSDNRREALGECRIGVSKTIYINAPTMLHLKPGSSEELHSRVWFTSLASEAQDLESLGWKGRQMGGFITWCFGNEVIEIIHA